jgi:hypothetical protein
MVCLGAWVGVFFLLVRVALGRLLLMFFLFESKFRGLSGGFGFIFPF